MSDGQWFLSESGGQGIWALSESAAGAAAVISAGTATITGSTTATVGCTTDTASGTLYALARTGATPASAATIIATGQSAAVSTTTPSIAYTGLTAATAYTWDMVQVVSAVNSNVLSDATGTTDNPGSGGGSIGILVPLGSLTLTGNAPTVSTGAGQFVAVPRGTLTLTGYAPTIVGAVVDDGSGVQEEIERQNEEIIQMVAMLLASGVLECR